MKKLVLYFLLLMVVPATAQSGLFGKRSHHDPSTPAREYHPRPMIKPGHHNPHAPRLEEIGMNRRDYKEAVRIINNENFDERRLATAERIIASNPMSTRQIANICKLFNFESNRLEFYEFKYLNYSLISKNMKKPVIFDTKNIINEVPKEIKLYNYGNLYELN